MMESSQKEENSNNKSFANKDGANKKDLNEASAPAEGQTSEASEIQNKIEELQKELETARAEANDNHNRYLRALADFDNLRRRTQKEREDLLRYGAESFLKELLPILDSFDKAITFEDSSENYAEEFKKGIHLVKDQLNTVLQKHGLSSLASKGQKFDPNHHQAISRIEADVEEELVHDEFVIGYKLHDRLLRPSMVSVAVPKTQPQSDKK